jgi:hypothetical protein
MMLAHDDDAVQQLLEIYDEAFATITGALSDGNVPERLHCEPLRPLFQVR